MAHAQGDIMRAQSHIREDIDKAPEAGSIHDSLSARACLRFSRLKTLASVFLMTLASTVSTPESIIIMRWHYAPIMQALCKRYA